MSEVLRVETDHRTVPEDSCLPSSQIHTMLYGLGINNHPAPRSSQCERVVAKCTLIEWVHQYPSFLSLGLDNSETCAVSRVSLQDHPLLITHDYTFGFSVSLLLLSKQAIHFQIFST